MGINFKPINEVPEVAEISAGDKLLINSGGAAKQIDASKFSMGGGGGSVIYADGNEDITARITAYTDAELTQRPTHAEGIALMSRPYVIALMTDGATAGVLTPAMWASIPDSKTMQVVLSIMGQSVSPLLIFSDSIV